VTAVVENNGDVERLQQLYTEGKYSLKPDEINRLLALVDKIIKLTAKWTIQIHGRYTSTST
jgi:hypothetical protein